MDYDGVVVVEAVVLVVDVVETGVDCDDGMKPLGVGADFFVETLSILRVCEL